MQQSHFPKEQSPSRRVVYLAGLPRSGSTLLCNLLGLHPEIKATPTSPLYKLVETLRRTWSAEESLLAQLDSDFAGVYARLGRATRAFIETWSNDPETRLTVDKSRGWLLMIEIVRELYPDFQMIVCLRDLRDVYASIERQHRRTLLLTFPDPTEQNSVDARATQLFSPTGIIGAPLRALYNLGDLPGIERHLHFWKLEDFLRDARGSIDRLLSWLGLAPLEWDPEAIRQTTQEADSYYHYKYPHAVGGAIRQPQGFQDAGISPRIVAAIVTRFAWYYRQFYRVDGRIDLAREGPETSLRVEGSPFGLELE